VGHFLPQIGGTVLEPCEGGGAFTRAFTYHGLPEFISLEIRKGLDFFAFDEHVSWIITNPPWSLAKQFLQHAYRVADNVVFLITLHHIFDLRSRIADMEASGFGIREVLLCKTPAKPWPQSGFQLGAVHLQRGYRGTITWGRLNDQNSEESDAEGTSALVIRPSITIARATLQFPRTANPKRRVQTLFWSCPRPKTRHWGSGQVCVRMGGTFGTPDAAFGKTDNIPDAITAYDLNNGYDWNDLPLPDNHHEFGFWDPPYDKMYRPEGMEIWRVCKRLAILHPLIYPTSWFAGARREAMVAVTFGPFKIIRCLQFFTKDLDSDIIRPTRRNFVMSKLQPATNSAPLAQLSPQDKRPSQSESCNLRRAPSMALLQPRQMSSFPRMARSSRR
jgi:hypothetical protein